MINVQETRISECDGRDVDDVWCHPLGLPSTVNCAAARATFSSKFYHKAKKTPTPTLLVFSSLSSQCFSCQLKRSAVVAIWTKLSTQRHRYLKTVA